MKKLFLILFIGLVIPQILLADSDRSNWSTLLNRLRTEGEFKTGGLEFPPPSFRLRQIHGNQRQDHVANYISLWGFIDSETSEFVGTLVTGVEENWQKLETQNWLIDQWLVEFSVDGNVLSLTHRMIVESIHGEVLSVSSEKFQPNSSEAKAKVHEIIAQWIP